MLTYEIGANDVNLNIKNTIKIIKEYIINFTKSLNQDLKNKIMENINDDYLLFISKIIKKFKQLNILDTIKIVFNERDKKNPILIKPTIYVESIVENLESEEEEFILCFNEKNNLFVKKYEKINPQLFFQVTSHLKSILKNSMFNSDEEKEIKMKQTHKDLHKDSLKKEPILVKLRKKLFIN